jgi:hypothetical protein
VTSSKDVNLLRRHRTERQHSETASCNLGVTSVGHEVAWNADLLCFLLQVKSRDVNNKVLTLPVQSSISRKSSWSLRTSTFSSAFSNNPTWMPNAWLGHSHPSLRDHTTPRFYLCPFSNPRGHTAPS